MISTSKAIVLRAIRFKDNDLIITVYSKELGRQDYIVRCGKSRKSRFKISQFQPLSLLEVTANHKAKSTLNKLSDCKVDVATQMIQLDPIKRSIATFLAEFLYRTIKEVEENEDLFNYVTSSIQILDIIDDQTAIANFHLSFTLQFSRFIGVIPNLSFSEGKYLDIYTGETSTVSPAHGYFFSEQDTQLLSRLHNCRYDQLGHTKLSSEARARVLDKIIQFYEIHLGHELQINSLSILHEIFN